MMHTEHGISSKVILIQCLGPSSCLDSRFCLQSSSPHPVQEAWHWFGWSQLVSKVQHHTADSWTRFSGQNSSAFCFGNKLFCCSCLGHLAFASQQLDILHNYVKTPSMSMEEGATLSDATWDGGGQSYQALISTHCQYISLLYSGFYFGS